MDDNKRRIKKKKFKNKLHESATIEFLLHPCFKIRRKNIITKKIFVIATTCKIDKKTRKNSQTLH